MARTARTAPAYTLGMHLGIVSALVGLTILGPPAHVSSPQKQQRELVYVVDSDNGSWDARVIAVDANLGRVASTLPTTHRAQAGYLFFT